MTLVMPRLIAAVAGFLTKHGSAPTRVIVPHENWELYQADRGSVPAWYNSEPVPSVLARVQLIPVPHQVYIAVDDQGRYFDYGSEDGAGDAWQTVRQWLEIQEGPS